MGENRLMRKWTLMIARRIGAIDLRAWQVVGLCFLVLFVSGCQVIAAELPTRASAAVVALDSGSVVPATWTPESTLMPATATLVTAVATRIATGTPLPIPTNTPVTPSPTPSVTPFPSPTGSVTPDIRPLSAYGSDEVIPIEGFPRPAGDNGWGIHWIPTTSQEPGDVDRFIDQVVNMHIKWVVFLNEGSNIGSNDYLVSRLVNARIMPVMRIYRSNISPYDGDIGKMVAHYRARGVYYYQIFNEPNTNEENSQGFSNPNQYATAWAATARDVLANGGLPGIGALSPGGAYDHYSFLARTLTALRYNGDLGLLNHAWLSVHNYHGLRPLDDPDGFLLFRNYDEIVRVQLHRSMPMIGTEGGSYSPDPQVERQLLTYQYSYMRDAEPYFFAFSHWILANKEGGAWDDSWEWQALFRSGFVHPVVTEFFYKNSR
jgi:hypothetical protein